MAPHSVRQLLEKKMGTFCHFVLYVFLEWMLILLLFMDGVLAFLSNEFARYFDLQVPCLLCTRIDHVFVHRNPDFYCNETICESHKKSISRMAYCHVHKKLSDIRSMCEGCLLSFATEKDADCDTYKSLVGILNKDLECFVEDDSKIHLKFPGTVKREEDMNIIETEKGIPDHFCSCCGEPLKVKPTFPKGNSNVKMKQHYAAPTPTPKARNLDPPQVPYAELRSSKGSSDEEICNALRSDAKLPLLIASESQNEDQRTPIFARGNKYFGIALDSPTASPRWTTRISKKSPLEKTEYPAEPDGTIANYEIDGESILHRLKRQVRLDRKSLIDLYMELDEERSASTEAANNAMAMITRLQAEKAAVQMEALQYQRMMEEQAEYDQEALQLMKELLDKRDEDVKIFESELDVYRERFGPIDVPPSSDNDNEEHESNSTLDDTPENAQKSSSSERSELLKRVKEPESRLQMVPEDPENAPIRGAESGAGLTREVSNVAQRLDALEEDGKFLKQAAQTLEKNEQGVTVLSESSSKFAET